MIRIENLSCGYQTEILKDINITIEKGEILVILGRNGCGKTTLLKTIAGLIGSKGAGNILVDDKDISDYSRKELARKFAFLQQTRESADIMVQSLVEHGRFPYLSFSRRLADNDKKIVDDAMKKTGAYPLKNKNVRKLSGGERQRVYLALALAQDTDYLFLDEPTTYLDLQYVFETNEILKNVSGYGKSVVAVMHDLQQALDIADKICLVGGGEIKYFGSSDNDELLELIKTEYSVECEIVQTSRGKQHIFYNI